MDREQAHGDDVWRLEGVNSDDDFWDIDFFLDQHQASFPSANTSHSVDAYDSHAPDTLFPPPRDFLPRSGYTQTHPQSASAHTSASQRTTRPLPASGNPQEPAQHGFGYIVDHLFDLHNPPARQPAAPPLNPSSEYFTLEDFSSEFGEDDMAPSSRLRSGSHRSETVDLTGTSSSHSNSRHTHSRGVKRPAERSSSRSAKRRATEEHRLNHEIEEIDLSGEAPSTEEELRQQQQREAIRAQEAARQGQEPQRIGQRQCIICMENYTNATVTVCGHFFCHECLTQALIAGERNSDRGVGTCPVCRKPLSRKRKHDIIPISFMTEKQFKKEERIRSSTMP